MTTEERNLLPASRSPALDRAGQVDPIALELISASRRSRQLREAVEALRGKWIDLPHPDNYVFIVGPSEDTILTPADILAWRAMPVMGGSVLIVGTIGHRTCYLWDRCVIGIAEDGSVMGYEVMNAANYVIRVADNICELLVKGPNQHYLETMRKIVLDENITEATVRRISKRLARARGLHMDSDTELTPGDVMRVHGARLKIGTGKDNDCPITDTEVMESSSILFCG